MKKTIERTEYVLEGVSTLDTILRNPRIILLLLVAMMALGGAVRGGHSTLDYVDPSFNPKIQTLTLYGKQVSQIIPLPDGKMLVLGNFNTYNGQPVNSGLARLNADGTLDTTFNPKFDYFYSFYAAMIVQADGKILVPWSDQEEVFRLNRLNADGSVDPTFFEYSAGQLPTYLLSMAIDASGRIILSFNDENTGINRGRFIRLNSDGSPDPSFQFSLNETARSVGTQNNKIIISSPEGGIWRLNENGTIDSSFIQRDFGESSIIVQPDRKILIYGQFGLRRLNENGSDDTGFTVTDISSYRAALADDGRITVATPAGNGSYQIRRFLADGTADSSFTPYLADRFASLAVQAEGDVLIGDGDSAPSVITVRNDFVRLLADGSPDPTFNTGIGFQVIFPGNVNAINVQPDQKILIGGQFYLVNGVTRSGIARLNADSTLDPTFEISIGGTANYFSFIGYFTDIRTQSDGKIVASGLFDYVVGGVTKSNLVRLNSDGSIDPTFILGVPIGRGGGPLVTFDDGKLLVGTSRHGSEHPAVPVKLTAAGERDTSFNANLYPQADHVQVIDMAVQPDGKIILGGVRQSLGINQSFLTRLNADGSSDTTFQTREQLHKLVYAFVLLPNGKIVVAENGYPITNILRLNADGTVDPTSNTGTADGGVTSMLLLSTGRIFAGGQFKNFNSQPRGHLVQLNEDGSVFTPTYDLNGDVWSLAVDAGGRVFVGGSFTTITAGSSSAVRFSVAVLIDAVQSSSTRFDFDGDRRADVSVFRPSDGVWYLNCSTSGFGAVQFGLSTDKITPADFDGDGRTDIAVYRDGFWYWLNSSNYSFNAIKFGSPGDIPVPADFTGDGRAELAVYRSGFWYTLNLANNQFQAVQFGLATDKPVASDYDGDGRADYAVYRDGNWYLLQSTQGFAAIQFGLSTDKTVPADYDGDGKTDVAVYRDGVWYLQQSSQGFTAFQFGIASDTPAPADYDGDGLTDAAVFRNGTWYLRQSANGFAAVQFGLSTDQPAPAAYLP